MKNHFIVDNRIPNSLHGFESITSNSSYLHNIQWFLSQYCVISESNSGWLSSITSISVATTATTSRLLPQHKCNIETLSDALLPKFTSTSSTQTWEYFMNALKKLPAPSTNQNHIGEKIGKITLFTTDIACLAVNDHAHVEDNTSCPVFNAFCTLLSILVKSYQIRIVCVGINAKLKESSDGMNRIAFHKRKLQLLIDYIEKMSTSYVGSTLNKIESIIIENNPIYYENELKLYVKSYMKPMNNCKLNLQLNQHTIIALTYTIQPVCIEHMSLLHEGLTQPELHSIISRNSLNPLFIKGNCMSIKSDSNPNVYKNQALHFSFTSVTKYLSIHDYMLVLRVYNDTSNCHEYWCMIPPSGDNHLCALNETPYRTMNCIQLQDNENMVHVNLLSSPSTQSEIGRLRYDTDTSTPPLDTNTSEEEDIAMQDYIHQIISIHLDNASDNTMTYNPFTAVSSFFNNRVSIVTII